MRIDELIGYKSNNIYRTAKSKFDPNRESWSSPRADFRRFLTSYGFKHIGKGSFADAYEKPGYPWIFKMFNYDKAYFTYLNYALTHQNNPAVPKIKGKFIKIYEHTYVVRLEKLTRFEVLPDGIRKLLYILQRRKSINDLLDIERNWVEEQYPDIYKIYSDLSKYVPPFIFDFHEGNVMKRSNNTVVVIDPLVD